MSDASTGLYVRLPSRVAEENYAIAGGFAVGAVLVVLYAVLVCVQDSRVYHHRPATTQFGVSTMCVPVPRAQPREEHRGPQTTDMPIREPERRSVAAAPPPRGSRSSALAPSFSFASERRPPDCGSYAVRGTVEMGERRLETVARTPPTGSVHTSPRSATDPVPSTVSYHRGGWTHASEHDMTRAQPSTPLRRPQPPYERPLPLRHPDGGGGREEDDNADDDDDDDDAFHPPLPDAPPPSQHVTS